MCSWRRSVLVKEGGKPQVPWKHFGNLWWDVLKAPSSSCSVDPSYPEFARAQAYMVLFVWGPVLPVTCPRDLPMCLANSCPGKSSLLSSPMKCWLRTGCLRAPAKGIAKGILVGIRTMALFGDSALCFGKCLACLDLEKPVLFLLARGCGAYRSQTAASLLCPEPCLLWECRTQE